MWWKKSFKLASEAQGCALCLKRGSLDLQPIISFQPPIVKTLSLIEFILPKYFMIFFLKLFCLWSAPFMKKRGRTLIQNRPEYSIRWSEALSLKTLEKYRHLLLWKASYVHCHSLQKNAMSLYLWPPLQCKRSQKCSTPNRWNECKSSRNRTSHYTAFALLALIQIAFFLLLPQSPILSPLHSCDFDMMFALHVPPPQLLSQASILIVRTNRPFPRADFDFALVFREMKLGKEYLRGALIWPSFVCMETEREDGIS